MGVNFIDYYTPSHFIAGVILERLNINFNMFIFLVILFEFIENIIWTDVFTNKCIKIPGLKYKDCKTEKDSVINSLSDILFGILGYKFSKYMFVNYKYFSKIYLFFIPIMPFLFSAITTNIIKKIEE